ncbi:hypothetical protein PSTG_06860 [Puccinia striiformis f. sp. tritici PST-78]|uniref:Uncharacterized protein n=1 Tax=Puccinia striiformis f. sp. tritici PST-78 TaxID=1165861 RepID=A0A0L0VLZ4_9BASI|nr:hypothetical protein PSTG_06860 [Puccinia striiformis f. sp. tritici PST-78]
MFQRLGNLPYPHPYEYNPRVGKPIVTHSSIFISIPSRLSSRVGSGTRSLVSIKQYIPKANLGELPSASRPPSSIIMVHFFRTTFLFAVLLIMATTPGPSAASAALTGPTPPGDPVEGEGGNGGHHHARALVTGPTPPGDPVEGEGGNGGHHHTRAIASDSRPTVVTPGNNWRDGKIVRRAITLDAHPHPVPAGEGTPRKTAHGV